MQALPFISLRVAFELWANEIEAQSDHAVQLRHNAKLREVEDGGEQLTALLHRQPLQGRTQVEVDHRAGAAHASTPILC